MNEEIMYPKIRFWDQLSAPDDEKWAPQGPQGQNPGISGSRGPSKHFRKNHEKKVDKNICVFSAKVSWDILKLTPERRDTYDGRKKLIQKKSWKRKVGKKGVIIDVKIRKHQFLHAIENAREEQQEEETIYIKE